MPSDRESDILYQIVGEGSSPECPPRRASDGLICPNTTVAEAIRRFPGAAAVFKRYGLNCPACANSQVETVESVSVSLQAPLRELLRELNIAARAVQPNAARLPFTKAR